MARVLVAMSGGVDSSVAAALLVDAGASVAGVTMLLAPQSSPTDGDVADAAAVCATLGIPHHVLDLRREFEERVIEPFVAQYEHGRTPSPCVGCNPLVKFGLMLEAARELGYERIATGHYARIDHDPAHDRWLLRRGLDAGKDQSYMLCKLPQEQLAHALLPLGELVKEQVRALADSHGLSVARKRDSQDICFIPDGDYLGFLERRRGKSFPEGDVLDWRTGAVLGRHHGAAGYTIGQRKGLGVACGQPRFVCAKDMAANTVTLGPREALLAQDCLVEGWNWIAPPAQGPLRVTVRCHYRQREFAATLRAHGTQDMLVLFDEPQGPIAPGQALVAYQGELVIGGGTIAQASRGETDRPRPRCR